MVALIAHMDGSDHDYTAGAVVIVGAFALVVACIPGLVIDLLLRWWWARHRRPQLIQALAPPERLPRW